MTDAPALAKLAAEMRALLVAADARIKELSDAATERFDKLNERIAELAGELAEARCAEEWQRNENARLAEVADDLLSEHRAENAKLRETVERLCEMLEDCYRQFNFYADEHEKAGKTAKAATNRGFADRIKAVNVAAAERTRAVAEAEEGRADG